MRSPQHERTNWRPRTTAQGRLLLVQRLRAVWFGLQLHVVLDAHLRDEIELCFEEVDVFFLIMEDLVEQVARTIIAHLLAVLDRIAQNGHGDLFGLEIALEDFLNVLADEQLAEILEIRKTFEEEDALDQPKSACSISSVRSPGNT